ncbi:MAG TPA: roadblock/LC7 domain-containing protein [Verrucomicrobiae bacterium]|nr:roadblock/LC7 domain-containing protein [Verrucomicrobiae bacterium]
MFGFLKNLLRTSPDNPAESQQSSESDYAEAAPNYVPEPAARPARRNGIGSATASQGNPNQHDSKAIEVPLLRVLELLPLELQPRVRQPDVGDLTVSVPLEKVLAQLSRGAIKVYFGELRQAAPEVFTTQNDKDRVLVPLPLDEILTRLNPALITRRRAQRQIEVPAEISSPFDLNADGQLSYFQPAQDEAAAPARPARQTKPAASPSPARVNSPRPQPTAPAPAPAAVTPHTESVNAPMRVALKSVPTPPAPAAQPLPPAAPRPAPAAPAPAAAPLRLTVKPASDTGFARAAAAPGAPAPAPAAPAPAPMRLTVKPASDTGFTRAAAAAKTPAQAPAPAVAAPTPPQPAAPAPASTRNSTETLVVALAAVAEHWPDEVRKELVASNLVDAKLAVPVNLIEQSLKQGRIVFSWKLVRSWIRPAVAPTASAQDSTTLELPLKAVAPAFLARQQEHAGPQQRVAVDEDIPNLFFGFPQPESATPPVARPSDTNFYVWDDSSEMVRSDGSDARKPTPGTKFVAKYATPNEVVSRAAALDGVVGALIALPDGLMVANRLPPELNADTLAAFLPQIFGKVSSCTKELRMGDLNNLNFTVGNIPWKIFRVNSIFFAAFGKAAEPLPTAQLAALAAELDHKPK